MNESWKTIKGFSRYEASNLGKIRSINYKRSGKVRELKPTFFTGYGKTVLLNDDGKYKSILVHRVIMLAFVGESNLEINHINGDGTDNRLCNLEYVSHSENLLHAYRLGLQKPAKGEKNGSSKLTERQVLEIRDYVAKAKASGKRYWGRKELAEKYGVSELYIKELVIQRQTRKRPWSHI